DGTRQPARPAADRGPARPRPGRLQPGRRTRRRRAGVLPAPGRPAAGTRPARGRPDRVRRPARLDRRARRGRGVRRARQPRRGRHDPARVGRSLAGGHVDGALVFSLHLADPLPELIQRAGVPTVFGGRPGWTGGRGEDVVYVDSDNRGGARDAVRHLLGLGRERVAHITGALDQTSAADRLAGYRAVMADADPLLVAEGDFTAVGGERAMRELLGRRPDLDAVFAANDLTAAGALRALREHGRRVPDDVAVVGFDDMLPVAE